MKKAFILLAVISFALCSCDGNGKNQNNGESTPQQNEQTVDTPTDIGDAALFKPEGTAKDLFPNNCDTVCLQQGDLNKDGIQDLVICATPRNPENMMVRDDGYEYNFNEPVLAIYFGQDGELYKKREALIKPIQDEIYNAIQELASEKRIEIVKDRSADPSLIYMSSKLDISDQVLHKLGAK